MRDRISGIHLRSAHPFAVLVVSTLATTACARHQAGPSPGDPVQALPAQPPAAPPPSRAAVIPVDAIDRLRSDAARQAGVPLDSVSVLVAGERQLEYRGDHRGHFTLCPEGRGGPPVESGGAPVDR